MRAAKANFDRWDKMSNFEKENKNKYRQDEIFYNRRIVIAI